MLRGIADDIFDDALQNTGVGVENGEFTATEKSPIYVNSVLIAGQTLFVAGSTEKDVESWLYLYSVKVGKELARYRLPAMPVFDGMASAKGKLYLALKNGSIISIVGAQ